MGSLARLSIALGAVIVAASAPCAMAPEKGKQQLMRFYRSRSAGIVLAGIDLLWSGILLHDMTWGRWEAYKPAVFLITPMAFVLVIMFMDELLAPRALGGLFLLVPAPLLAAARWHESPLRYVIILLAYGMVVKGFILTLSPYYYRKSLQRFMKTDQACKAWGISGLAIGALVILLGLLVYQ